MCAALVIRTISIVIVYIFALEILLTIIALGTGFFVNPFNLLDLFVVGGTITLDHTLIKDALGSMLVFLRLWRFVRIVHGVYAAEHEIAERELADALEEAQAEKRKLVAIGVTRETEESLDHTVCHHIVKGRVKKKRERAKNSLKEFLPPERAQLANESAVMKWRSDLLEVLESHPVVYLVVFCLVVDIGLTIAEFLVSHEMCEYQKEHSSHTIAATFTNDTSASTGHRRGLVEQKQAYFEYAPTLRRSSSTSYSAAQTSGVTTDTNTVTLFRSAYDERAVQGAANMNLTRGNWSVSVTHTVRLHESHLLHNTETSLGSISLAIVFLFATQEALLILGRGLSYFRRPLCVLDFVVIVTTIIMNYVTPDEPIGHVLVFTRVWHFVRIIHGVYEAEHELDEQELEAALAEFDKLEHKATAGHLNARAQSVSATH